MGHVAFDCDLKKRFRKRYLIGVDEAGRGPLAGPVVSCACIINDYSDSIVLDITDSKKLTPKKREGLFKKLLENQTVSFGFGYATPNEIDRYNILNATLLAMKRAVERLVSSLLIDQDELIVVVDGNRTIKDLRLRQIAMIKGDLKSAAVGCASIFAKVLRDRWMSYYDKLYPGYGFKKHKGYPTFSHLRMIEEYGLSPIHRKTFISSKIKI